MKVAIADTNEAELQSLGKQLVEQIGEANVLVIPTDVSKLDQVESLKTKVYEDWGEVRLASSLPIPLSEYPEYVLSLPTRVIGPCPCRHPIRDCLPA